MSFKTAFKAFLFLVSPFIYSSSFEFWIPEEENFFHPNFKVFRQYLKESDSSFSEGTINQYIKPLADKNILHATTTRFRTRLNWNNEYGFHDRAYKMSNAELLPFLKEGFCQTILLQVFDPKPQIKFKQILLEEQRLSVLLRIRHPDSNLKENHSYIVLQEEKKQLSQELKSEQAYYPFEKLMKKNPSFYSHLNKAYQFGKLDDALTILFDYEHGNIIRALLSHEGFQKLGFLYLRTKVLAEKLANQEKQIFAAHMRDLLGTGLTLWINYVIIGGLLTLETLTQTDSAIDVMPIAHELIESCAPRGLAELMRQGTSYQLSLTLK